MSSPSTTPRMSLLALACALFAAAPWPSPAAEREDAPSAAETPPPALLPTVVVTGVAPSGVLTFETNPRLPRQPVPASDGADYLRTIPGFGVLRNGGTNGDPVLRGMFGSRLNLIAGDGATHGACPSRMDNAMSYVAPQTFDRLVVIKGPQSVRWGPGASAGTVRFEREPPAFDRAGMQGTASLLGGAFGRRDQTIDVSAGASRGFARIGVNRSRADDYEDGDGARVPSAWDKWNADASFGWTPDARTLLEAVIGAGDGQARYAGRGMDGSRFRRDGASLRFRRDDLRGVLSKLEASAYRNTVDHVMDNYTLRDPNPASPMPMPMASNVWRESEGGRVALSAGTDTLEWTLGADAQRSTHRQRSAPGRGAYRAQPWLEDARLRGGGVFVEAAWQRADDARLVAGARVDRARAEDRRPRTGGMMPRPNPTFGQTRTETLPAGFLRFEHGADGDALQWFAGLGHVARMPDYWELYSPNLGPAGAPNAFAGIAPERTTQLDLGLQVRGARGRLWATGYAGRIDDYILFDYAAAMGGMRPQSRARNVDARIHGLEAGAEWRPTTALKLEGSLAWAWGANLDDAAPLPQMPPLEARMAASWQRGAWTGGALLRGAARQARVAPGQGSVAGRDLNASPAFAVFSLNAGYRFNATAQVSAGVDNLFDRTYAEHLNLAGTADFGYPAEPVRIHEPGRNLWLKLDLAF